MLFDTHFHIIDSRFPLIENQGYLPPAFPVEDYRARTRGLPIQAGTVVAGSFQGSDTSFMYDALERLGPTFVGVIQISASAPDEEIWRLNEAGVRAVRFNLFRGGSAEIGDLDRLARRVYGLAGWHAELYVDGDALNRLYETIVALPKVSIDHLGLTEAGLPTLVRLAERGVRVKATGFGRVSLDVRHAIKALIKANPDCLMFGTDLPSQRAARPFLPTDIDFTRECVGENYAHKVFWENAASFYKPRSLPAA